MNRTVIALVALLASTGCPDASGRTVRLRMEIGYPMLAGVTGVPRVWAVTPVSFNVLGNRTGDIGVIAQVECRDRSCVIEGIRDQTLPKRLDEIGGRILRSASRSRDGLLILEPFPLLIDPELYTRLRFEAGVTKVIDVVYTSSDGGLVFQGVEPVGIERRQPVTWK